MILTQAFLFRLLLNFSVQTALFASVAAALVPLVRRLRAQHQYLIFLVVLGLCLVLPSVNTWNGSVPVAVLGGIARFMSADSNTSPHSWWYLSSASTQHVYASVPLTFQGAVVFAWALLILYRLLRFAAGVQRMCSLRRTAITLCFTADAELPAWLRDSMQRIEVLEAPNVSTPVTLGGLRPAVVLPSGLLPRVHRNDLMAAIAHEVAHIERRDFMIHLLGEIFTLPVWWHPGIRFLSAKVSQARELACDEDAAALIGRRSQYAQSLLKLASLCLRLQPDTMALSIFEGDNLEERIMKLTEKKIPLTRIARLFLVLLLSTALGTSTLVARATSLQATPAASSQSFAGTWHWMFKGRSFTTMTLVPDGDSFGGTATQSRIALDDQGYLSKADPAEDGGIANVAKTAMQAGALRVTLSDGFEFTMKLKDATHAEIQPVGGPPNMKPIPAMRAQ